MIDKNERQEILYTPAYTPDITKTKPNNDLSFAMVETNMVPENIWEYWVVKKLKNVIEKLDLKYRFEKKIRLKKKLDFHEIEKELKNDYKDIEVLKRGDNHYGKMGSYFSIKYQKLFFIYIGKDGVSPWITITTISHDEDFSFYHKLKTELGINANIIDITWNYIATNGRYGAFSYTDIVDEKFYDEAYPYIEEGLEKYIGKYFESKSNILILQGPPGTGKTKFLRKLMLSSGKDIIFTADESLLTSDQFFVKYLESNSILILEDMDNLFKKRIDGNMILNKFLTISDGIMKVNKKIIFTTNIPMRKQSIGMIPSDKNSKQNLGLDEALTRPGRCFDILSFRKLTYQESVLFLKRITDEKIKLNENSLYTLAELYELVGGLK